MDDEELLRYADECEAQAVVLVKHTHGGFKRELISEAADLFTVAAAIRARLATPSKEERDG